MVRFALLALGLTAAVSSAARADFLEYYVGWDRFPTLTSGIYAGQPNPNAGRLTLLYAHTYPDTPNINHYHSKGIFTYTGPVGNPTVIRSASNFLPEGSAPPLPLLPGSGANAGRFVSGLTPGLDFSDLQMGSVNSLAGFPAGSPEAILFNSSLGRWNGSLAGTQVALELVSSSPGLGVLDENGNVILRNPGDRYSLGDGTGIDFTPTFFAGLNVPVGTNLSASFRLVDTAGVRQPSGDFRFNFRTVATPEPGTVVVLAVGLAGVGLRLVRRRIG